jgi:hypothetical protein
MSDCSKLEDALDYTIDPHVRTLIDIAQQAIEEAKHVMEETQPTEEGFEFPQAANTNLQGSACLGGYRRAV